MRFLTLIFAMKCCCNLTTSAASTIGVLEGEARSLKHVEFAGGCALGRKHQGLLEGLGSTGDQQQPPACSGGH